MVLGRYGFAYKFKGVVYEANEDANWECLVDGFPPFDSEYFIPRPAADDISTSEWKEAHPQIFRCWLCGDEVDSLTGMDMNDQPCNRCDCDGRYSYEGRR